MYKKELVKNYSTPPLPGNPRAVEAWGLTQAAIRMKDAQDTNDREAILAAVRLNWQLWTIIQAELLSPECTTPIGLRTNALSLAKFIDKHTVDIIGGPEAKKLEILITINRELAGGLYETPSEASEGGGGETLEPASGGFSV